MKKSIFIIGLIVFAVIGLIFALYRNTRPRGLVAFVIDDWGYNKRNIELVFEIKRPLAISILPNLKYSNYIAKAVRQNDRMYDIILHLPLESKSGKVEEINTIKCSMKSKKILFILKRDIEGIPGLVGVSNHQGSKATEDKRVMRIISSELKKRKLFFLDSMTTVNSVCSDIARDIGLKYARRDIFLDITDQTDLKHFESYIRGQIRELANVAIAKGSAIGIGHNKKITLEVIKDVIPELEKERIKIVPLKTLLR